MVRENTDIIIPVWNQPKLTKECIEYIVKNTHCSYQLVIVDNGSEKETKEYLEGLAKSNKRVTLIRNEMNLGYVKAINQGLRESNADYVCLLNNDTKVGKNWLEELIKVAESDPKIGIVNPGGFRRSFRKKALSGRWIEIGFAIGFCMLIKREVIDKIGFFDEIYDIGFWEDTDYSQRAKQAGYICVSSKAAYVYHHSHKSFDLFEKNRADELFEKNKNIFYSRWGRILRYACVIFQKELENRLIERILKLARNGHMIYLFLKRSTRLRTNIEHGNIRISRFPDYLFNLFVLLRVLHRQKKKKKFDKLLTDSQKFAHRLKFCITDLEIDIVQ